MGAVSLPRYKEHRTATRAGSGLRRRTMVWKTKPTICSLSAPPLAPLWLLEGRCHVPGNVKQSTGSGAIKSSVSAASMEGRQLQRFHFHLDFKQLYKRASILVKLILSLVGLDGDCIRLSAHRGWRADPCACVYVPKHSLYLSFGETWPLRRLKRHFHSMGHSGRQ